MPSPKHKDAFQLEIMFVSLTLLLWLTLPFSEARIATKGESNELKEVKKFTKGELEELGKIIFLPSVNLLDDFPEKANRIFDPLSPECLTKKTLTSSSSKFDYYKNTNALYKSLATESSLSASLTSTFTLGATVSVATKSKSSQKSEVSGISLIKQALAEKIYVNKECLTSAKMSTLNKEFMESFSALPLQIKEPWLHNSWKPYSTFLEKYGSHVITSVDFGSRFQQMVFAESSESYSERDFQVRACISAAGPTDVGELGVSACSNVTNSEKSQASKMTVSETRFVRGGLRDTNSALNNGKTSTELIKKLMNEADEAPKPVQHTLMTIWSILQSRFESGSKNYHRATNLQYYYSGYLDYGCPYSKSGNVEIQKFDYKQPMKGNPEFVCTLADDGCHNDNDCHYVIGVKCACRGKTCVRYHSEKQITGQIKQMAYINNHNWMWEGCNWKKLWIECGCYNKDRNERKVVWFLPITSKDAGKHKAPGNGTYDEAKDPVTDQARGITKPYTAKDAAKHSTPGSNKHHAGKHPVQWKEEEEEEEDM